MNTPDDHKSSVVRDIATARATTSAADRAAHGKGFHAGQEDFKLLVDSVKDYAIFMLDPEGRVMTWNQGAKRLKGYEPQEIIGQYFSKFYPPEDVKRGKCETELVQAAKTGRVEDEGWRLKKDGSRFWANVVITALYDENGSLRGFGKVTRDLTERRQMELQYRLLVDGTRDYAIFMLDPEGRVASWNPGAERIKGYTSHEIIGQHFSIFYTEEDREKGKPERELETARTEGRYEEEGIRVRKDGTPFWANVVVTPLYDEEGKLFGYSKVSRDITEKKEAEGRYKLLVDTAKDYGIFMLDPSGRIQSWNAGAEKIKGYKAEEVIGKHFSMFYTPEDLAIGHPAKELHLAATNGRYEEEGWRLRKDGTRFWANIIITRLNNKNGNLLGFSKVTRDLTERKKAEDTLKESEERFRLMVDNVKDYAILTLDPKGHITSWNAGAERIKGWKPDEIIGRQISIFYPPEDVKSGKAEYELEAANREGRFEDFGWRVRKDGSRFWANVIVTALRDETGRLKGFSKITRDITEQKKAEDELRRVHAELEKKVEDRTHALQVANKELEAFTYAVSHDLRAPIRSMEGFTNALMKTYADRLDEKGQGYLKRVVESAQKMAKLIDDLLDLSRLGKAEIRKTTADLSGIARDIASSLQKSDPNRKVEWIIADGVFGDADPNLMRVALENLLGNSWKYTSKNPAARIEFGMTKQKDKTVYFIKDDGAGFNMAYSDKLFGTFQRLHSPKEFTGTGVGLSTVKRIVERHGGEVWAQGEVGKGATFYFTLSKEKGQS